MARSAVVTGAGLLGAAIGSFWGSPQLGFALGSTAGALIANFALPSDAPAQKGPRLTDLKVTSSAYGAFIPIGFGTIILGGNIIWSTDYKEHKRKAKGGKGSASSASAPATYYYTASFALGLAFGPASDVTRIWFNGKLWFDKTGTTPFIAKSGLKFRFYKGTDTQLPDPLIKAALGEENTSAWRGLAYIVVDELDLTPFGNAIPTSIQVELTYNPQPLFPYLPLTIPSGAPAPEGEQLGVDLERGLAYAYSHSNAYLVRFELNEMIVDRYQAASVINTVDLTIGNSGPPVGLDGYLYISTAAGSNASPLIKVYPESLWEKTRFGYISAFAGYPQTVTGYITQACSLQLWNGTQIATYMIVISKFGTSGNIGVFDVGDNDRYNFAGLTLVQYEGSLPNGPSAFLVGSTALTQSGLIDPTLQEYALAFAMGPLGDIVRVVIYPYAELVDSLSYDPVANGVHIDYLSPPVLDDIAAAAGKAAGYYTGYHAVGAGWFDQTDNGIICLICLNRAGGNDVLMVKWTMGVFDATATIIWATVTGIGLAGMLLGTTQGSRIVGSNVAFMSGSTVYQFDTTSGAMKSDVWPISAVSVDYSQLYDAITDSLVVYINAHNWTRLFLNRGNGGGTTDGTIVTDLCGRVGLTVGDIDVTPLTDSVYGYVISNQSAVKDNITPLGRAFFFDQIESDFKLKFVKRGGASVVTVNQDQMMLLNGGQTENQQFMSDTITQDVDLPLSLNVSFPNKDQQDQPGSVEYRRIDAPDATMGSQNRPSVSIPIVMTGTDALQIAEQGLDAAWINRHSFKHALSPRFLRYDGTDPVTFAYNDNTSQLARLSQVSIGADLSLDMTSVSEDGQAYSPALIADAANYPAQSIGGSGTGKLFVLDIPLLRTQDDTAGTATRLYLTASGYGAALNPMRSIMVSHDDGATYEEVTRIYLDATWGVCVSALPDTAQPFTWTDAYTLTVRLTDPGNESFSNVTEVDVFNGSNVAAIIKSNGDTEIIGWTTATHNADGSYTLSHLIRGLCGTEVFTAGHSINDTFLLIDKDEVTAVLAPLSDIGVTLLWKVVTAGQVAADIQGAPIITHGRDMMPYAPVDLAAAWSIGDLHLTWVRRTRIGGEWADGTENVQLNERTERYEVDIYSGSAVVRTLTIDFGSTPTASPGIVYSADQIYQDFGASPPTSSLKFAVYQISAVVGRGFGLPQTIAISGTQTASHRYYGASNLTSLTAVQVKALSSSDVVSNFDLTATYNCTGGAYPYFCYPQSFGMPANVKVNGLPFSDFTQSVVVVDGVNYDVLRFNNLQNGASIPVVWA